MSFRPRGPWSRPDGNHNRFQAPHGSAPYNPQRMPEPHTIRHSWPPPAPNNGPNINNSMGMSSNHTGKPVEGFHPLPPNFQHFTHPGPPPHVRPQGSSFQNPPPSVPPPSFYPNPTVSGPPPTPQQNALHNLPPPNAHLNLPPPIPQHNYNYVQPRFNTPNMAPSMPNFPPGVNLNGPPPPLGAPSAQMLVHHQMNSQPYYQFPPPRAPFTSNSFKAEPPVQIVDEAKAVGLQKLEQWLKSNNKSHKKAERKTENTEKKSTLQIGNFLTGLKEMHEVITGLSNQVNQMASAVSTSDEATWESSKASCVDMKDKLCSSFEDYLQDGHLQEIQKKLSNVRHKRERLKRARASKYEEEQQRQQGWAEKSKNIDKWQEHLRAKIQEENREKRQKLAADRTLSKVTREIHDATRLIDTMLALEKLRLIRRDAAQKRGDNDIGESRQQFEEKIKDMTRLVKAQLECYKQEEAKLKQVLKSEEEEKSKLERQDKEEKAREHHEKEDLILRSSLFGPDDIVTPNNAVFPFNQYYTQAGHSLAAFLQIRQGWDSFLVPKGTPASSCIPSSWVIPEGPSSSVWATALQ